MIPVALLLLSLVQSPSVSAQTAKETLEKAAPKVTVEGQTPSAPKVEVQAPTAPKVEVNKPSVKAPKKPKIKMSKPAISTSTDALKMKAMNIPSGSPVSITGVDGAKISGTLEGMTNDGLSVRSVQNGRAVTQTIPYAQVKSLKGKKGKVKLGHGGIQTPQMLDASIAGIPEGSPVNVKLADSSIVSGRFAGKTPDGGIAVQVPQAGGMTTRNLSLDQVASIKMPKGKLPGMPGMPALQSPAMVKKALSGFPVGSPVNLNMPGGQMLSGKLAGMTATGFSLQTLEAGNLVTKNLSFDQVASVKPPSVGITKFIPGLRPPSLKTPAALKADAINIPAGSPVTLNMPDGSKIAGKLTGVTNDGVQIQGVQGGNLATQTLGYDQIGSIKQGVPVTKTARLKTVSKAAVGVIISAAVAGLISGKIAR
jgi:hypothetical protein